VVLPATVGRCGYGEASVRPSGDRRAEDAAPLPGEELGRDRLTHGGLRPAQPAAELLLEVATALWWGESLPVTGHQTGDVVALLTQRGHDERPRGTRGERTVEGAGGGVVDHELGDRVASERRPGGAEEDLELVDVVEVRRQPRPGPELQHEALG